MCTQAGGIPAVLNEIARSGNTLHLERPTVSGMSLGQSISGMQVRDYEVIRPLENPHRQTGGLAVLFGNLAPAGRRHQDRRRGSSISTATAARRASTRARKPLDGNPGR